MKQRILVVDDESSISELLSAYFSKHGYYVRTAATANDAMRCLGEETFDLVISDIGLTDGDGLELLAAIRLSHPNLPVLMMTGMGYDEELIEEARRKGASGYVSKKLPLNQLLMEVLRVLKYADTVAADKAK